MHKQGETGLLSQFSNLWFSKGGEDRIGRIIKREAPSVVAEGDYHRNHPFTAKNNGRTPFFNRGGNSRIT